MNMNSFAERRYAPLFLYGSALLLAGCFSSAKEANSLLPWLAQQSTKTKTAELKELMASNGVTPLEAEVPSEASLLLGEALFNDKIISGPKNISCATCHHPALVAGDTLTLPVGVGGEGKGQSRTMSSSSVFIHRNAPEIHNRTMPGWKAMFWDGRVEELSTNLYNTPAGPANANLPAGLKNIAAVQALFPMLSRTEMLGFNGGPNDNDLARLDVESDPSSGWNGIMTRLKAIPAYVTLFQNAYPSVDIDSITIAHAANAIADYEGELWNTTRAAGWSISSFNLFLMGHETALNESAVEGGLIFFGKGGCYRCHSGPHLSDMKFHNLAVPQLGSGFGSGASMSPPRDLGRFETTGVDDDKYRFRTAPLREVPYTGPYMHNGAFTTLREVILHHLNAKKSLESYTGSSLNAPYSAMVNSDTSIKADMLARLDANLDQNTSLSEPEIVQLIDFLHSMGSPTTLQLGSKTPSSVPSGLPVD